ncbi:MAG: malate synthase A [Parvibaculum sp.]|uniref:malate synthase A n=1 Tax=Parvibaculum sp. TaxID=2024848 RepID=UPI00284C37D8|nr:malate synthase A [Parvibaculum sp.]MDR3498286.1 malate synthase A [Parvibaculum sp.]
MSQSAANTALAGIKVRGKKAKDFERVLTEGALAFVADLERRFGARRRELLDARAARQKQFDAGVLPDFLPETKAIREGDWKVAPIPKDLLDRRVEITGPVDSRKMIINALNSGAQSYMTDFEDAAAPTWANMIGGQLNLIDYWDGKIGFTEEASGKSYSVKDKHAVLNVRPRGWHLEEAHVEIDGKPMSGSLFDFGIYFFHNAKKFKAHSTGPYFYLPKMESHKEARLWNDVFVHAQKALGIPNGTIKATVLIETLPAAFEMHEILYELKDHIVGLNCGRWDYIFSYIKRLGKNPNYLLPDRASVVMGKSFLNAYSLLLVKTCHLRGAFAMGGMAAQIPVKGDEAANEAAFNKVRADKERESTNGHDGTWVAHPDLVPVAMEIFGKLTGPNQLSRQRQDVNVGQKELLEPHQGQRTEEGMRECVRVGVQYIEAWLGGRGAVPLYNLMEDAATAEISRTQIWQWLYHAAKLADGRTVTPELFHDVLDDEMKTLRAALGETRWTSGHFEEAIRLFAEMATAKECEEFLTLPAYKLLVSHES